MTGCRPSVACGSSRSVRERECTGAGSPTTASTSCAPMHRARWSRRAGRSASPPSRSTCSVSPGRVVRRRVRHELPAPRTAADTARRVGRGAYRAPTRRPLLPRPVGRHRSRRRSSPKTCTSPSGSSRTSPTTRSSTSATRRTIRRRRLPHARRRRRTRNALPGGHARPARVNVRNWLPSAPLATRTHRARRARST